ncbi:MAG TPA: FadR/GntR family transcriptional regulator [Methylomirabilota bacterium]|nr:FadR/GntR family transcriptional regulator [Methylomirabilota bacterium]
MVTAPAPDRAADRGKLHASVVAAIEAQILSGELQVGDRLPSEGELARRFAISTRSVREGLQILETKGLVRRRHGEKAEVVRDDVGQFMGSLAATVRKLFARDADYLMQLMDVRRMFEVEVAGRLAVGEGALDGGVERALEDMRGAVADRDFPRFTDADAAFHRALVQALGNDVMSSVYGSLHALVADVIRVTSRVPSKTLEDGLAEHEHLHALIRSGDVEASRSAMRRHIDNSAAYLQRAIVAADANKERTS